MVKSVQFVYTLLAWGTGTAFLVALLIGSFLCPDPTPPQLRIQASILALAAAGFATVLGGLLNMKVRLGTQLTVGATGALAILVLFYLYNPAVLTSSESLRPSVTVGQKDIHGDRNIAVGVEGSWHPPSSGRPDIKVQQSNVTGEGNWAVGVIDDTPPANRP